MTQKPKRVAFSKIGKSIKFVSPYSPAGGDVDAPSLLRILANNNPDVEFYIVGKSDLKKVKSRKEWLKLFPYDNVINVWQTFKGTKTDGVYHIDEYFKELGFQPDAHVCMVGQVGTVTIPGKINQIGDPSLHASVIDMTLGYTSPLVWWMNEHQEVPIIEIICDPRYTLRQSRDIIPNPKASLSQFNGSYDKKSIRSYEDQTRDEFIIPFIYASMESLFLYDNIAYKLCDDGELHKKPHKEAGGVIILNEGDPSRYDMLKEWILDKIDGISVYGRWEHPDTQSDPRFKGSIQFSEVFKVLSSSRWSFIIPIAPGWVTSKYLELIYAGVVPIFHPSYDSQLHLDVPQILRPKNQDEMLRTVELLKDDTVYEKTISYLRKKFIRQELIDGTLVSKNVMSKIYPGYILPELSKFQQKEAGPEGLESLFF